ARHLRRHRRHLLRLIPGPSYGSPVGVTAETVVNHKDTKTPRVEVGDSDRFLHSHLLCLCAFVVQFVALCGSKLPALVAAPEAISEELGAGVDAMAGEVAQYIVDVALEQVAGVAVGGGLDRLREVDYGDAALVVEDVEGRQVGVDALAGEPQLDVAHQHVEERLRLLAIRADTVKRWRGA